MRDSETDVRATAPPWRGAGIAVDGLELRGIGTCSTAVVALDDDSSARLVLARMSREPFGPEDISLLRGMSRVLTLTL
jgi:hypothetical protein